MIMIACIDDKKVRAQIMCRLIKDLMNIDMSLSRIALRANIHRVSLYKVLGGKTTPNYKSLVRLSDFYVKVFNDDRYLASEYYLANLDQVNSNLAVLKSTLNHMKR